jgi:hypothetical protein
MANTLRSDSCYNLLIGDHPSLSKPKWDGKYTPLSSSRCPVPEAMIASVLLSMYFSFFLLFPKFCLEAYKTVLVSFAENTPDSYYQIMGYDTKSKMLLWSKYKMGSYTGAWTLKYTDSKKTFGLGRA